MPVTRPDLSLSLQFADPRHRAVLPRHKVARFIRAALELPGEITVRVVDAEEGRSLNHEYRQKDYATNVLTFDYSADPVVMADLVLCAPVVEAEARAAGKDLLAHYAHLLVHGTLHAQGWDHEDSEEQAQEMEQREREVMAALGFADPYAELPAEAEGGRMSTPADTPVDPSVGDTAAGDTDPLLWLEEVQGDAALAWVRAHNEHSHAVLCTDATGYTALRPRLHALLDAKERIAYVRRVGLDFYNFWQDAQHRRGLWRRTTLAQYRQAEPVWETVLDLDALAAQEGENWVWHGVNVCSPSAPGQPWRRALVHLSRGGADAVVVREFDLLTQQFIAPLEGGFTLPEAKSSVTWCDADTLFVGTDTGPGSLTEAGYPRQIRRWPRGTALQDAPVVFEGQPSDVSAWASVDDTPGHERVVFGRSVDFYTTQMWLLQADGSLLRLDKPADASLSFHEDWALLELRSDWATATGQAGSTVFAAGSLLVARAEDYLNAVQAGASPSHAVRWEALFTPTERRSLSGTTWTREHLLLNVLDQVANRVEELRFEDGQWQRRDVALPGPGTLGVSALYEPHLADDPWAEQYWVTYTDFLTPDSLMWARAGAPSGAQTGQPALEVLKQRPHYFAAEQLCVEQRFARSADGTAVPYFLVRAKALGTPGAVPTLLYGYGGFEVSLQPWYSGGFGLAWFERGGALAVANIRGGGEFGPTWHQAAVGPHKQRSYDDFIAVAEDLIHSGHTCPARLGIMGGSNGGLLVGAVMVQRPELFGAVVCQVPLLDMRRYHRLLAGASWMAEYGDPDAPADWAVIQRYSPYQNVQPAAQMRYPRALFTTSTRDDRVHPGHARKMVARLEALGHEVLYHENIEGGHGGAADNAQRAHLQALEFAYLWAQLGAPVASTGDGVCPCPP